MIWELFSINIKEFGKIDVLINNAGISISGVLQEMSVEEWQRMLGVNLSGAFYCTKAVLPNMINRKCGKIINISSIWGLVGASCETHYAVSKAGLDAIIIKGKAKKQIIIAMLI